MHREVPRVPGRAHVGVGAPAAHGELDGVGLAEHDHARRDGPLRERGGDRRDPLGPDLRATGRHAPLEVDQVLERDGHAVERAHAVAGADRAVGALGGEPGVVRVHRDEGVERGVATLDALEEGLHRLDRGQGPRAEGLRQLGDAGPHGIDPGHVGLSGTRLSETMRPSLRTRSSRRRLVMCSSGLAATTIRSASLPGSMVPRSSPTPQSAAAWRVAASSACHGVAPAAHPQPQLEEGGVLQRADVGAERHRDARGQGAAEGLPVRLGGGVRAPAEIRGEVALLHPALLPRVAGLIRRQVRDGERRDVPGPVRAQGVDAGGVHDVAVLDAVRAQPGRGHHGLRVRGVRHDPEAALAADRERGLELLLEEERLRVAVPRRAHDAAGQVQLDVVDAVLDLLADRPHEAVGPVALPRVAGGEEVPAGRGQEVSGREHPGAHVLARVEGPLPRHVHEVGRARAAHADHAALGQGLHEAMAEDRGLLGDGGAGGRQVVGMDVDVPQPGQEIGAAEIDDLGVPRVGRSAAREHLHDAAAVDDDAGAGNGAGRDAVDHRRIGQHASHRGDPARAPRTGQTA